MVVNRKSDQDGNATLTIYFKSPPDSLAEISPDAPPVGTRTMPSSSTHNTARAPPPAADEHVVKLEVRNKESDEILAMLLEETGARIVPMSEADAAEMTELDALEKQGIVDRKKNLEAMAEKRKEEEFLAMARKAAGIGVKE